MKLTIENNNELIAWMNNCMMLGHGMEAVKGPPPVGATYSGGDPIVRPVNVRWRDVSTGEVCNIDYWRPGEAS